MVTSAVEEYLKVIYEFETAGIKVTTSAIADKLGIAPASVTGMIKRLAKEKPKLVNHRLHREISLTDEGRRIALRCLRKQRLLKAFLVKVLNYSWEEVGEDAHLLEHHISDRLEDKLDAFLGHPTIDPHGQPIPGRHGEIEKQEVVILFDLETGDHARITGVSDDKAEFLAYLKQTGLVPGTSFQVMKKEPFEGPLTLRYVKDGTKQDVSIGAFVAKRLNVEKVSAGVASVTMNIHAAWEEIQTDDDSDSMEPELQELQEAVADEQKEASLPVPLEDQNSDDSQVSEEPKEPDCKDAVLLSTIQVGQGGTICGFEASLANDKRRDLQRLGVVPGASIKAEFGNLFGEATGFRVGSKSVTLAHDLTNNILVDLG